MARRIDADIALKEILSIIEFRKQHYMDSKDYESFAKFIEQQPTIEEDPVKYGRWIVLGQRAGMRYPTHYCSECGQHGWKEYQYCQHCGAKMDGE